MNARLQRLVAVTGLAFTISGCATLGSNVSGDFACRAPGGTKPCRASANNCNVILTHMLRFQLLGFRSGSRSGYGTSTRDFIVTDGYITLIYDVSCYSSRLARYVVMHIVFCGASILVADRSRWQEMRVISEL